MPPSTVHFLPEKHTERAQRIGAFPAEKRDDKTDLVFRERKILYFIYLQIPSQKNKPKETND